MHGQTTLIVKFILTLPSYDLHLIHGEQLQTQVVIATGVYTSSLARTLCIFTFRGENILRNNCKGFQYNKKIFIWRSVFQEEVVTNYSSHQRSNDGQRQKIVIDTPIYKKNCSRKQWRSQVSRRSGRVITVTVDNRNDEIKKKIPIVYWISLHLAQ